MLTTDTNTTVVIKAGPLEIRVSLPSDEPTRAWVRQCCFALDAAAEDFVLKNPFPEVPGS